MSPAILIIEDERTLAKNIATYLTRSGYEARVAESGEVGLAELDVLRPEAIILDYALPGINGLEVLQKIKQWDSGVPVIMMTGHGSELIAVEAMKAGAHDYLTKPVVLSELLLVIEKVLGQERREQELEYHRRRVASDAGLEHLIGESSPMRELKNALRQLLAAEADLAGDDAPAVLITGETGTGKELVARALHYEGQRAGQPFLEINCSTLPADLLEAELFGYERGAFTDAKERKLGLVEAASGGTLFLDEVGDMDVRVQAKLLKLLEDKTVRRLGSVREQKANVRIVAATNRDLHAAVRHGQFRADLLFRLNIVHLHVAPLRERGDDIERLALHYLAVHMRRYRKRQRLADAAIAAIASYSWPGNVRELRNVIEQAVIMSSSEVIGPSDLRLVDVGRNTTATSRVESTGEGTAASNDLNLGDVERDLLVRALAQTHGNVTQAARLLGVSRDTLRYRIEKYNLKV
ncbi:MAG: sigma-54 dependent transcriptional regulator [Pseudomonadota bacterium]|nr:sigma-54 dependent transcriptional regulator [Pseudomonadota bacterium]